MSDLQRTALEGLSRLAKWRSVFAGWQLGTRASDDAECQAVRDAVEARLMLRVECSALLCLLIDKGVVTLDDWNRQLIVECGYLQAELERKFPGFKATETGISIDPQVARRTTQGWKP